MEWGKQRKGIAMGIISFCESIGASVFSLAGTMFINPLNEQPDIFDDGNSYFGQQAVLERVPWYLLALGTSIIAILLPTAIFIQLPPEGKISVENSTVFIPEMCHSSVYFSLYYLPLSCYD